MTTERSDRAYEWWLQETTRFDYFVLGACLATFGYLANAFQPIRLGVNPSTAELASILALLVAVFAGFKRIESSVVALKASHSHLYAQEATGSLLQVVQNPGGSLNLATGDILTQQDAMHRAMEKKQEAAHAEAVHAKWATKAKYWYRIRNVALLAGLVGLLAARIWRAYM